MPSTYAYFRRPIDPPTRPDPDAHLAEARARLGIADPAARTDPEAHLRRALVALCIQPDAVLSDDADALTLLWLERHGVSRLLARLAPGDTVVTSVWSFAGALDLARLLAELLQRGVNVVVLDPRGRPFPASAQQVGLCAVAIAGMGRKEHDEAIRTALDRRKAVGLRYTTYAPYGYKWAGNRLAPDWRECRVFARIAELRHAGLSCERIAAQLLREKVTTPTGREYSKDRVRRVLLRLWGTIDPPATDEASASDEQRGAEAVACPEG